MTHKRSILDQLWAIVGAVNIRTKIMGIVVGFVLLLGFVVTIQVRLTLSRTLHTQLEEQSISVTHDLAARSTDLILINDMYRLHELLQNTQNNNTNVRYVLIVTPEQEVLAHTFGSGFPAGLLEANTVAFDQHHHTVILETKEGKIWDTAVPIFGGQAGIARVGIADTNVQQAMNSVTGQLLITTLLVSAIGITAATLLTWLVTRPILQLVKAAQKIGQGDFTQRVERWADDEIGELTEAFNIMASELGQAAEERTERDTLRAKYVNGFIAAQEDERKRIARELHDSTSQTLTSLVIGLRTLSNSCSDSTIRIHAEDLREVAAQALDEVHDLALQLRPSVLDDHGLPEALNRHLIDCRRRHPLTIDLAINGLEQRLPPNIETALYRIIQETLNNIFRHAQATTASICVERRNDQVVTIIEDDGQGFDLEAVKSKGRLGLYGIQERVELLSGQITIESTIGSGTSLFIEIPVR